jgi:hypothetical protein
MVVNGRLVAFENESAYAYLQPKCLATRAGQAPPLYSRGIVQRPLRRRVTFRQPPNPAHSRLQVPPLVRALCRAGSADDQSLLSAANFGFPACEKAVDPAELARSNACSIRALPAQQFTRQITACAQVTLASRHRTSTRLPPAPCRRNARLFGSQSRRWQRPG